MEEDSLFVPGYGEPVSSDQSLDRMITTLVPTFREASSPIQFRLSWGRKLWLVLGLVVFLEHLHVMGFQMERTLHGRGDWGLNYHLSKLEVPAKRRGQTFPFRLTNFLLTLIRGCLEA
jgi:hypothetical protein